jgi:putative glutamine amidotransferase
MTAPLIAVVGIRLEPDRVKGWRQGALAAPESYLTALHRAGLNAAILPNRRPAAQDLLARFDGLLLLGGGDVDPGRYGAAPHPGVVGTDAARDEGEISSLLWADRLGLPTFAICRGIQVMNVAFGGTLFQHLPDVHGLVDHGSGSGGEDAFHEVKVAEGSRLAAATGRLELTCRSNHHQAIDALGGGLRAVAWSAGDGLVEAVERDDGWMVGVQWHPERSAPGDPAQQALFDAFADAVFRRTS